MNDTLHSLMREATRLTQAGRVAEATDIIQRALGGGRVEGKAATDPWVLDDCVIEVSDERPARSSGIGIGASAPAPRGAEAFTRGRFSTSGRTLDYKLYVPPAAEAGRALPLVVMLHGCTQDPDDFAAGTGMNEFARDQGFYVLYPAQAQAANAQCCWNWFKHNHQQRGQGEPALIAGITRRVMQAHAVDERRVYVAGLSAGGAMAAIVAQAYPELFAAVGVHSGLPIGAASNLSEALNAMKNGAASTSSASASGRPSPMIVFHGDKDQTVHQRNGEQLIAAAMAKGPAFETGRSTGDGGVRVETGVAVGGRRYTRSVHVGGPSSTTAEHWLVHGAGHAWSGGRPAGSYTDAQGPDATREMLRFFFEHPHAHPGAESA